jgi:hypothetical protein
LDGEGSRKTLILLSLTSTEIKKYKEALKKREKYNPAL